MLRTGIIALGFAALLMPEVQAAEHEQGGYTLSTNTAGLVGIYWRGEPVALWRFEQAMVSPDNRSVAWVEPYSTDHPGFKNEGGEETTPGGKIWIAHGGGKPVLIQRPETSRGMKIFYSPRSGVHTWYPNNLTWDSTSAYLYFEASGCLTAGYLWRVLPGESEPMLATMVIDYTLRQEEAGPDSLLAYQRYIPETNNRISYGWFAYPSDSLNGEYERSNKLPDQPLVTR